MVVATSGKSPRICWTNSSTAKARCSVEAGPPHATQVARIATLNEKPRKPVSRMQAGIAGGSPTLPAWIETNGQSEMTMKRLLKQPATLLVALAGLGLVPMEGEAQRRRGAGGAGGPSIIENALRLGDEIGLTEDQRGQLESLRLEVLEERQARAQNLMALRSEIRAGLREPEAMRQEMGDLREAMEERRSARRDQLESILSEDQRSQLRDMSRTRGPRGRQFRRGRDGPRGPWDRRSRGRWNPGTP